MRTTVERWERWIRTVFQSRRTQRIEEDRRHYLQDYQYIQQYLEKLQKTSEENQAMMKALEKRMGV